MLTATQKLKQWLVFKACGERCESPDAIQDACDRLDDCYYEAQAEYRCGECETGLPCDSSRHYSSRAVAAQMLDGSWVGWTYWYGGGKHGEPGAVPWIEDAYDVTMTEVMKPVRQFTRVGADTSGGTRA